MSNNKYLTRSVEDFLKIPHPIYIHILKERKTKRDVYERILNHFHFRINEKQKMIILGHLGAILKRYDAKLVYNCFVNRIDELKGVSVVPMLKYIEQDSLDYLKTLNKRLEEKNINVIYNNSSDIRFTNNPFCNKELYNSNVKSTFKLGFGE